MLARLLRSPACVRFCGRLANSVTDLRAFEP